MAISREEAGGGLPLTERVLRGLPGRRLLWLALWVSAWPLGTFIIPRLFPGETIGLDEGVAEGLTTMYGAVVALWGTAKLAADIKAIGPAIDSLTGRTAGAKEIFRGLSSVAGPVGLTAATLMMWTGPALVQRPGLPTFLTSIWGLVTWLPSLVLAWTAGVVLLGLHRLGGRDLHLKPFEDDRSLGLRPLGSLAFTPFLILVASVLPALVFAPIDLRDVALDVGILVLGVLLLFASLQRLRRQMLAAKATQWRGRGDSTRKPSGASGLTDHWPGYKRWDANWPPPSRWNGTPRRSKSGPSRRASCASWWPSSPAL